MKTGLYEIIKNSAVAENIFELRLFGDNSAITRAGQFVNIRIDGFYLRRPISVCDLDGNALTLIYKVVGGGTGALSQMKSGTLDVMTGLGNGYDLSKGNKPLLIGGGVGVPPMYLAAKKLVAMGKKPVAVLGFNSKSDAFYTDKFSDICQTHITTVDGSLGQKGFVTDAISEIDGYDFFYVCGPEPMLKSVYNTARTDGQFSFEERMGCGFGACMGCSCETKYGSKRICKDGPVLNREEIIW